MYEVWVWYKDSSEPQFRKSFKTMDEALEYCHSRNDVIIGDFFTIKFEGERVLVVLA